MSARVPPPSIFLVTTECTETLFVCVPIFFYLVSSANSYHPGENVEIIVRVLTPGWQYRGLLLHAVDASGNTVGKFQTPAVDDYPFHTFCPGAVLHGAAELKPYRVRLVFTAPSAGTGKIVFRCLLKRGPANHGSFYYPATDLVLEEAAAPSASAHRWALAPAGQSCDEFCSRSGARCDADSMQRGSATGRGLVEDIGGALPVFLPVRSDCSSLSPARLQGDYRSFFHDKTCAASTPISCTAAKEGVRRYCVCEILTASSAGDTHTRTHTYAHTYTHTHTHPLCV